MTDLNIELAYKSMLEFANNKFEFLDEHTSIQVELAKKHMLSKFELWMAEDLRRLGLIN